MMVRSILVAMVVAGGMTLGGGGAAKAAGQGGEILLTDLMAASESVEERTMIRVSAGRLPDLDQPGRAEPTFRELMTATRPYFRPALEALAERAAKRREEKEVVKAKAD
jgi:hypothetical protein